jgi:hypothetical protein
MKKLLFLGACLLALASQPVMAQTGGADIVVVRINDTGAIVYMAISHGAGKTESLSFPSGYNEKRILETAERYQQVLTKLYQEGYSLKSTFTVSQGLTTLVFVKGQ